MNTSIKPVYDVRVIRLVKSSSKNSLAWFYGSQYDCNICLGHFDVMWTEELLQGETTPLETIQYDSNKSWGNVGQSHDGDIIPGIGEENYAYPLYLLRQLSDDKNQSINRLNNFWSQKNIYTVVTRFHCDVMEEDESFSELLLSRLKVDRKTDTGVFVRKGEDDQVGDIRVQVQFPEHAPNPGIEADVWVTFYESLELGDIVGIAKGSSVAAILEVQRHLYESKWVSDAYSYCGIHKDYFRANDVEFKQLMEMNSPLLDCTQLNYISTRFSVRHAKNAEEYFKKTDGFIDIEAGARYFVTGTADLIIDWGTRSEKIFLEIMRCIANLNTYMYDAFNDVITRIGLTYTKPIDSRTEKPKREEFASKVPNYKKVIDLLNNPTQAYPWAYQLLKLLGTLHTMYDNCVMDDLSALLVPGVSALLDRIYYLHSNELWKREYNEEIFAFLDCWALLTNDISHLESQLVQHPELSPVRYFIPAMVLQYEQLCVRDCASLLQTFDVGTANRKHYLFEPILIPSTNENTSTRCVLDPWNDDQYKESVPLRIFLPINKLYQPWKIAHILCHEVAHYCGDLVRHRKERLYCLICSAVIYLLQQLDSIVPAPQRMVSTDKYISFVESIVENIVRKYHAESEANDDHLKVVRKILPWAVWSVCENPQIWEDYQNLFLFGLPAGEQLRYASKLNVININLLTALKRFCDDHITQCLIPICKECYADIVMILLLDCSFQDYFDCVFQDEYAYLKSQLRGHMDPDTLELHEQHIDRLVLVSLVISELSPQHQNWLSEIEEQSNDWVDSAKAKIKKWNTCHVWIKPEALEKDIFVHDLCAESVEQLLTYLRCCAKDLNNRLDDNTSDLQKKKQQLKELICLTKKSSFNWNEIRKQLQKHEKDESIP